MILSSEKYCVIMFRIKKKLGKGANSIVYLKLAILILVVLVVTACQGELNQFKDSHASQLIFADDDTETAAIYKVNWSYGNLLTLEGYDLDRESANQSEVLIGNIDTKTITAIFLDDNSDDLASPCKISPNGKHLACGVRNVEDGFLAIPYDIQIMELDQASIITGRMQQKFTIDYQDHLAWSPDSQQLAFLNYHQGNTYDAGEVTMHVYTLGGISVEIPLKLPKDIDSQTISLRNNLSWSPDGKKIAFSLFYTQTGILSNRVQADIFIYDLEQEKLKRLTSTNKTSEQYPSWHPNGNILLFVSNPDHSSQGLFDGKLMFSTGDGLCMKVLPDYEGISSPSWSPDGTQLMYISLDGIEILDVGEIVSPEYLSPEGLCDMLQ